MKSFGSVPENVGRKRFKDSVAIASYLSHHFKTVTGKNLLSYLTEVRMVKAAQLLATSALKVNIIGDMVGYHKTQYFISLFKKQYGLTPQQYRRQHNLHQ